MSTTKPVGRMAKTSCFSRKVNAAPVLVLNSHGKRLPNITANLELIDIY